MAGPTNQLDWGKLISMYGDADAASATTRARQQQTEAAAQREAINKLMGQVEGSVYANVPQGLAGDVTKAPGYSDLLEGFNQNEARKYASNVEKAAWESVLRPQSQQPVGLDPYDAIQGQLEQMQGRANRQAEWNRGQQQWQQDQRNRKMDDNITGAGFREAWDKWIAGGGVAPDFQPPNPKGEWKTKGGSIWPDAPETTPNAQRLTANMETSQRQWRDQHGGSLDGWYDTPEGAYYRRAMGGYTPQTYQYTQGGYAGGFGAKRPDFNPNTTNDADERDDETSY